MPRFDPRSLAECRCFNCGTKFYRYHSQIKGYTFCSRECYNEWRKRNKKEKRDWVGPK